MPSVGRRYAMPTPPHSGRAQRHFVADETELGLALAARVDDVVEHMRDKTLHGRTILPAEVETVFLDAARIATDALSRWWRGEPEEVARHVGDAAAASFAKLAADQAAPLNEVTKRCLWWRDSTAEVLREEAARLRIDPTILELHLLMLVRSADATLVRTCEAYELERHRTQVQVDRQREALEFQATHDSLTGLPNRTLIRDRIEQLLARSGEVAAILIDLDEFKGVNDTYGHLVGDQVLRAAAARLAGALRPTDSVGRLGGDEFVIVLDGNDQTASPTRVAERILDVLRHPYQLEELNSGAPVVITASLGIATARGHGADDLMKRADIAMYRAKDQGKDQFAIFDVAMQVAATERVELEIDLRAALADGQFFLVYQPIVELEDTRTVGVEALIRWQHPRRGVIMPEDFIEVLEHTGLIISVGHWVLTQACTHAARVRARGHDIDISVNVSRRQIEQPDFPDQVRAVLDETGLEPGALVLEITETAVMRDPEAAARQLGELKRLGIRLAIDDFGTGYSSLEQLRHFPVDSIKIDRGFVAFMLHDSEGKALVHALVQLGKALHIETVAEGIEDPHQLRVLQEENCDTGQGFYFAQPLSHEELDSHLHRETLRRTA
jgi:diguanylate cyclase (GGDEF)-like protein